MKFAVEQWAPEYGAALGGDAAREQTPAQQPEGASAIPVEVGAERAAHDWVPVRPNGAPHLEQVCFVDGVRRVDARVWLTASAGGVEPGICASYAAGVVRCRPGSAVVETVAVERGIFAFDSGLEAVATAHGTYAPRPVVASPGVDPVDGLTLALQQSMGALERSVSLEVAPDTLLVVDGPLRERIDRADTVGYVKSHRVSYLPPALLSVVAALGPGERTPVFLLGGRFSRWSWYLRLPGGRGHPWAGVVRCEAAAERSLGEAVELADACGVLLARVASAPHKDPRAPQNLYPIAGLERVLRRRLGDGRLLYRGLRVAAEREIASR